MRHRFAFDLCFPPDVTLFDDQGRARDSNGGVLFSLGLSCTLYIRDGDRPEVREGMLQAYEHTLATTRKPFAWGMNPDTGMPESVASSGVGNVRAWPPHVMQYFDFQMVFHGGQDRDDPDPYELLALSAEQEEGDLSLLSVSLPMVWGESHPARDFVAWVVSLAERVGPVHGYAGPTLRPHVTGLDAQASGPFYDLGRRFRGLDLDLPTHHLPYLSTSGRIKPIGFVTVLDTGLLERLGGEGRVRAAWPAAWTHRFQSPQTGASGLVLQAGDKPRLGDVQNNENMADYERLARLLEPITDTNPALIWPQGMPGCSFDEAKSWMRRLL